MRRCLKSCGVPGCAMLCAERKGRAGRWVAFYMPSLLSPRRCGRGDFFAYRRVAPGARATAVVSGTNESGTAKIRDYRRGNLKAPLEMYGTNRDVCFESGEEAPEILGCRERCQLVPSIKGSKRYSSSEPRHCISI